MAENTSSQETYKKSGRLESNSNEILCHVTSAFPFQLFPDSITVDQNKIDIVYKNFFWNKYLFTILHEDLTTIKIHTGILFASAHFEVRGYETNPDPVTNLYIKDAIRLHHVIIGVNKLIKQTNDSKLHGRKDKLEKKIEKIGKTNEDIASAV